MIVRDILGREHDFAAAPRRVVSLVPSLTETLFDIGAGDDVAGITDFCIFPEHLDRPRLGGTKNPNVEAIRALAPDLVYVNLEENLARHAKAIEAFAPVFATEPKSVAGVAALIETLGAIHRRDVAPWIERLKPLPRAPFTFLCPIWKKPWMWCGGDTYVSNLIESVGGVNLLKHRERYPTMDIDCALALDPEVIFLPDEPYEFTTGDASEIDCEVVGPFPGHLVTWHGTRTVRGLEFLQGLSFMRK